MPRDPNKMPAQYWAYSFYVLIGVPLLVASGWAMVKQVRWLTALADLPRARTVDQAGPGGAVFEGRLDGPALRTALDAPAAAWLGLVTESTRRGRSSTTREMCRLGSFDGLRLTGGGAEPTALGPRPVKVIDPDAFFWGAPSRDPRAWLGPPTKIDPVPDPVVARCRLDRRALATNSWEYREWRVEAGTLVGIAGCAGPRGIGPCPSGVAKDHLSVGGMSTLVRRLADGTMSMAAVMALVTCFFTIVAGIGAALVMRRAARRRAGFW